MAVVTQSTDNGVPTSAPSRKVLAGAAGGTITTAVVTIAGYLFFTYVLRGAVPDELHNAIMTIIAGLVATAGSFGAAYLTPHAPSEGIAYAQTHVVTTPIAAPGIVQR